MRWKVLITAPRMLRDMPRLRPDIDALGWELVLPDVRQQLDEQQLLEVVGDIDAAICGDDAYTARVMDAAPKLKAICKWGTGIDEIDVEAARERGIHVRNVPDAFSVPVADTVLAFMLSFARRLPWLDRAIKQGGWEYIDGVSLAECTLGVVGCGNVGRTVLRRARAFGMRCLGNDPLPMPPQLIDETSVEMVELDELLAGADFVSLNCDLNPTSHHLVGRRELKIMKRGAVLINTARGPIVDEPALVEALESGEINGAGLDVFEVEPLPIDSPLRTMDRVILCPHMANSSPRACRNVHRQVIQNVQELLAQCETAAAAGGRR